MGKEISTRVALRDLKNISVEIIDNVDKWEGLKPQWDSLVAQSLSPSIFLTYEFLSSAWKALSHKSILHILLIKFWQGSAWHRTSKNQSKKSLRNPDKNY